MMRFWMIQKSRNCQPTSIGSGSIRSLFARATVGACRQLQTALLRFVKRKLAFHQRQYKSDTSTDRVREFRKRSRNVTETAPDTETEAETEKNNKPRKRGYAFDGQVIKLTRRDFDVWCKSYPDVDLAAKLQSRDDWLAHEATEKDRERWFMSTSNWLANQQQKVSTDNRTAAGWDGMA
jgi:hypothetical protein